MSPRATWYLYPCGVVERPYQRDGRAPSCRRYPAYALLQGPSDPTPPPPRRAREWSDAAKENNARARFFPDYAAALEAWQQSPAGARAVLEFTKNALRYACKIMAHEQVAAACSSMAARPDLWAQRVLAELDAERARATAAEMDARARASEEEHAAESAARSAEAPSSGGSA